MGSSTKPTGNELVDVLKKARELGFLGPGPVEAHIDHAELFVCASGSDNPDSVLDLGSGGGVPGLVLALHWRTSKFVLLDAAERRTNFLREAVATLGLNNRVTVVRGRAEEIGHLTEYRHSFDLVVARSFGSPAIVAECSAGFLKVGGRLVVSEPPGSVGQRWEEAGLAKVGLGPASSADGVVVIRQESLCPERFPRRVGIPAKRPLF